jgi:K+-sensing histidine kinase KdpD
MIERRLASVVRANNQILAVSVIGDSSCSIYTDPEILVDNVLGNIGGNAVKYSPTKSKIEIVIDMTDSCTIRISDEGPGIKMFDTRGMPLGGQLSNSGSGRGSSIAFGAMAALGGSINYGKRQTGTSVSLVL